MPIDSVSLWNEMQKDIILGDDNRWYTGEEVGHEPTEHECATHWATHGGPEVFAQEHNDERTYCK